MSATLSPVSNASDSAHAASQPLLVDRVLKIEIQDEPRNDIKHAVVPLFGKCPFDSPYRTGLTHRDWDVRTLGALTLRYTSERDGQTWFSTLEQDKVRAVIWRTIDQLLPASTRRFAAEHFSIMFDQETMQDKLRRGTIKLTTTSVKQVVHVVTKLRSLEIKLHPDDKHTYVFSGYTSTLPGNVMPIDCLALPVDNMDVEAIVQALKTITAPVGTLVGLGKVVLRSAQLGVSEQYDGRCRAYVKLHQEAITLPWFHFVRLLPTHLKWQGVPYTLLYRGREQHKHDVFSANFSPSGADEPEVVSTAAKRNATTTDDEASGSAAKKQRRSET